MTRWILLACLTAAVAAAAADVPTIHCPAEPPTIRTLELVERWRIDVEDEDSPLVGLVTTVRADEPGGDLYFLDRQLCQILVYDADGEFIDTLGRKGEGPGEFRRPTGLRVLDDGRLAVRDGWPTRLVYIDADGLPAGEWSPEGNWSLNRVHRVAGGWIAGGMKQKHNDETSWYYDEAIAFFDDDGQRLRDYRAAEVARVFVPHTVDERRPYIPRGIWDITVDSEMVVSGARDAYRLEYLDLEGNLLRVVERDFEPYRRTSEDKEEIRENSRLYINGERQETVFHLLDTEPAISWLWARDNGTVIVGTCYFDLELPDGVIMRYDVHGPDGALLEEVRLVGDCDLEYDRVRLLPDGRAVILRNYQSTARTMYNTGEEGDPVRDDDTFEVIVCDLREAT